MKHQEKTVPIIKITCNDPVLFGPRQYKGEDLTKPEGRRFNASIDYDLRIVFMTCTHDDDSKSATIVPFEAVRCIQFAPEPPPAKKIAAIA
jgi:hypothetical protein